MQGVHRLGRTDRTLLWGTTALIAFTLGAVTVARMGGGGSVTGAGEDRRCYNSAGVGAACLPPAPTGFGGPADATPAPPSPTVSDPAPGATAAGITATPAKPTTTLPPTTAISPPAAKPSASARVPAGASTSASARVDTTPAWAVGVAYPVGARVTYQGGGYVCRQAHTSQADWPPAATPALWSRVS
ncbi:hypothetical protein Daura_08215 [Dactylosporangium aurantiacum]|uniref:Chitin-binding type-3 domain-containing protein n=1 Tax=Dactylosporangium aurantiacum TaxID=35754 RepID=A0A9Q9MIR2_9ACTN|nr:carbohydrate-binding protein [Dactylosporangium aurantiacum]MDG6104543.1 hypothetical protein [Dactylosporangium aurantiacum]UWZ56155.1 hypothetical protein Daura_08215 [Dactylosporangium aurantiacum]